MKRLASLCISLLMLVILFPAQRAAAAELSEESVRAAMLALKAQYPEGTRFDNSNSYAWKGGFFSRGYGCAGFAFILSDAAFGSLPARKYYDYSQIRVGDILRVNNDGHSVIVLYVNADSVTVAEGNFNGKVHWGREIKMSEIRNGQTTYALTRYPESAPAEQGKGDLNGDAAITVEDSQLALNAYVQIMIGMPSGLSQTQLTCADVDGNSIFDVLDAQFILRYYTENTLAGRNLSWADIIKK